MNILLLGSGGREHAFAWKISQSKQCSQLFIAPGNAGTASCGQNVAIKATDFEGIKTFVLQNEIKLVVVGPEEPLVKGIHDFFLADEQLKLIPVIGPQKLGATLEGSKDFSKQFMKRHNIPTAAYASFTADKLEEGLRYLETQSLPIVLKADGLAAGKGVLICESLEDAKSELTAMLADAKFGDASKTVVVEQFLKGIELSVFVLTDGISYKLLPSAKDYKRIGEGDTGLNTGGMGSISPVPFANEAFIKKVEERIVIPTVAGLKKDNIPYKGFIFIGLMNDGGEPYVIEYNVRMGDPETESVLPRIKSDLVDLFLGVANENLAEKSFEVDERTATTIMLVSGGYPGDYEKGKEISGFDTVEGSMVFHAGTTQKDGKIVTDGGRVIAVTTLGADIPSALAVSNANAKKISFDGKYYRTDIGFDLK
ncbi:phosphoribosylamine--glycine ligase [Solitalea lacus]|uniref:phosphoribosylamine--glycine ligase n=1 Tax=Solitalea lacus TaxID=2911172 RepID=UPI001EDB5D2D|nr:phosphoribosylamine--glycine ligase [Solitalea lacus]UKJ07975.1 phosphoribosylamine--glycine ligase [Solitalea lacus]